MTFRFSDLRDCTVTKEIYLIIRCAERIGKIWKIGRIGMIGMIWMMGMIGMIRMTGMIEMIDEHVAIPLGMHVQSA